METYRLVIDSQEAVFAEVGGKSFYFAITKGKIFLDSSRIADAFDFLMGMMSDCLGCNLPIKAHKAFNLMVYEKLSADHKGGLITFSTGIPLDLFEIKLKEFFASNAPIKEPAPAPEVRQSDKVVASICQQSSPISIVSGRISLPCSEIAGAFNRLLEAMIEYSPNEYGELSAGNYEKISADFKKGIISFTTTLSIDLVDDTLKYVFSPLEPVRPSQSSGVIATFC